MGKLGILVGLQSEAACFPADTRGKIDLRLSTVRVTRARQEAEAMVASGARFLLSFGLAGGLSPDLKAGDLLVATRVIGPDCASYPASPDWHRRMTAILADLHPRSGTIVGSDAALTGVSDKEHLFQATGAVAVDMESHILGEIAQRYGLGFAMVRVVCDEAGHILPPAALVAINEQGVPALGAVLGSLMRHPLQLPALIRLGTSSRIAHKTLLGCGNRLVAAGFGLD